VAFGVELELDGEMIAKPDHVDLASAAGRLGDQLVVLPLSLPKDRPDALGLSSHSRGGAQSLQCPVEHKGMCRPAFVGTKVIVRSMGPEIVRQVRVATAENIVGNQDRHGKLTFECSNLAVDPGVGQMHALEPAQELIDRFDLSIDRCAFLHCRPDQGS
jgi:hypothetical protein